MSNRRSRRVVVCARCQRARRHEAHGLCSPCYNQQRKTQMLPQIAGASRLDSASRLPIPAQARCPGCPDVPVCPRRALPATGYCLRCGPLARVAA
jgi:hypothetical protein